MDDRDKKRGGTDERRAPPARRNIIVNEADRVLVRVVLDEIETKLGLTFDDMRARSDILEEILPTMQAIHSAYTERAKFWSWWRTTTGRASAMIVTTLVGLALVIGFIPALRIVFVRMTAR